MANNNYENINFGDTRLDPKPESESGPINYQDKLTQDAKERGNEFNFITPEILLRPEDLPTKVNWNIFSDDLNDSQKTEIELSFSSLTQFLASPIFTDSFSEDHYGRRDWEKKYLNDLSKEESDIYKSNRLRLNLAIQLVYFIIIYHDLFKPDAAKYLDSLASRFPEEILNGVKYGQLGDEDKIKVINGLSNIYKDAVEFIGAPELTEN